MSEDKEVLCSRCGGKNIDYKKSWEMKSGRSGVKLFVELWYCNDCRKSFRETTRI